MSGGRMTPCTPAGMIDRYAPGSNAGPMDRYAPGSNAATMERYTSRMDRCTPPEMEVSNCCRSLLMSRLQAAELMNQQLSDDARDTNKSRLRSVRPPGQFNVDLAIEQLRAQVASLLDADIGVIRHLLDVNEQIEEMKWQRKFGGGDGSPWTPSTLLSGSCTADIDSGDLDSYTDPPLFGRDPDLRDPRHVAGRELDDDVRRHVINGCFNDDVTDDVFQNDETAAMRVPLTANNASLSSELRFKVTPSGVKINNPDLDKDKVNRAKVELTVTDPKNTDDSKTSKVEFRVNGNKVVDSGKVITSHADLKVKGLDDINDKLKTTKVEFKVDSAKSVETKPPNSKVEVRFLVSANDAWGQGHSYIEGHSRRIAAAGSTCQSDAADSSQHAPHLSRDVKPTLGTSGPIRRQRNLNETNRETKPEHGPQLRIVNLGRGPLPGHAGITTPRKVRQAPFSLAGENEASETVVVHL